jgi:N-acylneuraminate cytidylyltransferase
MRSIAIIPARGGSKRIPRKNLALFGGRPAIARVIETARKSGVFETVAVSTDDAQIAAVSREAGAVVVARPAELADDRTPMNPVILHALNQLDDGYDALSLIFATAVFLEPDLLRLTAERLAEDPSLDYVLTLCRFPAPPQRGVVLDEHGRVSMLDESTLSVRTQDLTPVYRDAGLTTMGRIGAWRSGRHSYVAKTVGLEVDPLSAIDIDEPADLSFAQTVYAQRQSASAKPRILLRTDLFPGSGLGHARRSGVLADALAGKGFSPVLMLDAEARTMGFPFDTRAALRFLPPDVDEHADAQAVIRAAREDGAQLVVRDSYRVGGAWEDAVAAAGLTVIALDDLGTSRAASLAINYTPGATPSPDLPAGARFLGGEAYMLTDSPRRTTRVTGDRPLRVLAHAGGAGGFDKAPSVVDALVASSRERGWRLSWLCPTEQSEAWLRARGAIAPEHAVERWRTGQVWAAHDLVVGPASTSLYEVILQGALPLSFPIADNQGQPRETWLRLGHALHLEAAEAADADLAGRLLALAEDQGPALRALLAEHSSTLDGHGAERVASAIAALADGAHFGAPAAPAAPQGLHIRACTLADAERFRIARNAPETRAASTHPDHLIDWPEHLCWWITANAERFVVEEDGVAKAYFWHRAREHDGRAYLTAGWFPAPGGASLAAAAHLLRWQHARMAETHPGHSWVATVEKSNPVAAMLNKRVGFTDAGPEARAAAAAFWPGVEDDRFLVFEKPARAG